MIRPPWIAALALATACGSPGGAPVHGDVGGEPACHRRETLRPVCSGAEWPPGEGPRPTPITVCDACAEDGHCVERPGGRCVTLRGDTCEPDGRVCVYPGDLCFEPTRCADGDPTNRSFCMHRDGRAVCARPADPPP